MAETTEQKRARINRQSRAMRDTADRRTLERLILERASNPLILEAVEALCRTATGRELVADALDRGRVAERRGIAV